MAKTLGCLGIIGVALGVLALYFVGEYNGLVRQEQAVEAQWAQVENVYQRRADLVPNLVATVKGAADFEQETLTQVVQARSRVGQISAQATQSMINDPQKLAQFEAAQDQLSSALSRLLVVVERYPELKSVATFQDLMTQLEGTENRIAVERRRFNDTARDFNTRLKRIPTRWFIGVLGWGFQEKAYFQAQEGAERAPQVNFDFGAKADEPTQ
jgi:LemA protein